jgi:hypothetical protein
MNINVITQLATDWGILLIPLVLAITSMAKGFLPDNISGKWSPVISVLAGIAGGLLTIGVSRQGVLTGLIIGLSASGLYSGSKSVVNAPPKDAVKPQP